jgi:hypothetical protein
MSSRPPRGIDNGQSLKRYPPARVSSAAGHDRDQAARRSTDAGRTPAGRPLLHTHAWTDNVPERLLGQARKPTADADTMGHQFLRELG